MSNDPTAPFAVNGPLSVPSARRRRRAATPPKAGSTMLPRQRWLHWLLCLLVLTLILEGLLRKLVPPAVGLVIFFLKDFLSLILLGLGLTGPLNAPAARWLKIMGWWTLALLPCLIVTADHDPLLAVFGAKQYGLFAAVTVAACAAYLPDHRREFFFLIRLLACSVVVTTAVAVLQNRLPPDHWLNLSVGGDSLEGFSAGGFLRVSSTFPFVAQYCAYLNALCYALPLYFFLRPRSTQWWKVPFFVGLAGLFIVGSFITGSRGAVIGNAAILSGGGLMAFLATGGKGIFRILLVGVCGVGLLVILQARFPDFFAAYEARVAGTDEVSHTVEIEKRVTSGLLDWTEGSDAAPPSLFGYGLGVMSNGSEKLSRYAAGWRSSGFWTETAQATTFFEGGWYLIVTWYGFRVWVILHTLGLILRIRRLEYRLPACFVWGFVLVIGVVGTLGIQPPQAIWWWLAVGLIQCLAVYDIRPTGNGRADRTVVSGVENDKAGLPDVSPPAQAEHPHIIRPQETGTVALQRPPAGPWSVAP